jgi:hypothetical protein
MSHRVPCSKAMPLTRARSALPRRTPVGAPRSLQGLRAAAFVVASVLTSLARRLDDDVGELAMIVARALSLPEIHPQIQWRNLETATSSTVS